MTRTLRCLVLGLLVLGGCAASTGSVPMHQSDPVVEQAEALRDEQLRLLYQFDTALGEGQDGCATLCTHHTRICELSTRICDISKGHPQHYKARAACEKATETCRETTTRLPEDCTCE